MIVNFDKFDRLEPPALTLCNPACHLSEGKLTSPISALSTVSDLEIIDNFNEVSELNFSIQKELVNPSIYAAIMNRRSVYAEDIGFFIIMSVEENESDTGIYKSVSCQSCEIELQNRMMPYIPNGIYSFNDIAATISGAIPSWAFNDFSGDTELAEKMRVFEDVDIETDVLSYMIDELQRVYGVLFEFDTKLRRITVHSQSNFVQPTGVQISASDVLDSINITENSDDIYTVLNVEGGNELYITPVNPTGENRIYNFSHYKEWMSPELRAEINAWEVALAAAEYSDTDPFKLDLDGTIVWDDAGGKYVIQYTDEHEITHTLDLEDVKYLKLNQIYFKLLDESENLRRDIDNCNQLIEIYQRCKENIQSETARGDGGTVEAVVENYNTVLSSYNVGTLSPTDPVKDLVFNINERVDEEANKISEINSRLSGAHGINDQLKALSDRCNSISEGLRLSSYISTPDLLNELEYYMYQATYTDEYTVRTDSMTMTDEFKQSLILYNGAKEELSVICHPTQEFSVDAKYFIGTIAYKNITDKINVGRSLISVVLHNGEIAELFLTSISVDYSSGSLSFTFSNRYNKYDSRTLYGDVFGDIKKTATSVSNLKTALYPVSKGQLTKLTDSIRNARSVSKTSAITSTNQEVNIDETGYTGRRSNGQGGFDPQQVKIINNSVVFTDDGWQTAKTAVGEMNIQGRSVYGINAEAIVGELIVGNNLAISVSGEDLIDILEALSDNIASAGEYKNWMTFDPARGLIIGDKRTSDVDSSEYTFYTIQTARGYEFYRSNNPNTPFMYISAIDGSINVDIAQISDKLSIGSDEYGGYYDFITTNSGLAIKWRDAETQQT